MILPPSSRLLVIRTSPGELGMVLVVSDPSSFMVTVCGSPASSCVIFITSPVRVICTKSLSSGGGGGGGGSGGEFGFMVTSLLTVSRSMRQLPVKSLLRPSPCADFTGDCNDTQ